MIPWNVWNRGIRRLTVVELARVVGRRNGRYTLAAVRRQADMRVVVHSWAWRGRS